MQPDDYNKIKKRLFLLGQMTERYCSVHFINIIKSSQVGNSLNFNATCCCNPLSRAVQYVHRITILPIYENLQLMKRELNIADMTSLLEEGKL